MMNKFYKNVLAICMVTALMLGNYGCGSKDDQGKTTREQTAVSEAAVESTQAETQVEKPEESNYVITLDSNNSWESNGMTCAQFDGVIKNQSQEIGKDWSIRIAVPENAKLENGWNGTYELNGTELTITPVDYNTEIAAGSEITFGFILDTQEAFTPENVILSIGGAEYALGAETADKASDTADKAEDTESDSQPEDAGDVAEKDTSGTPVANHGELSVKGTDIVDKDGKIFQLKGVSTHGINWFPDYVNKDAFASLASYGVNAIRLAMYTADYNGYCSGGNQKELEALIDTGVQACSDLGLYVIIDWHILNDNDPNQNKETAKTFFDTMSKKYAGYNNVIYEICNEPNGGTTWENVKAYSEEVIPVIRQNDNNALIIVGTPNWSQDVDIASGNPITGQENILYAVHFYASTHKEDIRNKVKTARKNGLPVIVSECSICEASGNGSINYEEAQDWMELIKEYHLSFFAWNLSNKDEQSSLLKSSVTKTKDFTKDDFSETGIWFMEQFEK
ncbi:MAG: cellulase family glycosylhydrolase [Lachnospiraceae bacterium]